MKIGIITFHRAHNYGAVLQCYALCMTLKSIGHDVEVIDYYPPFFRQQYSIFSWSSLRKLPFKAKFSYLFKFIFLWPLRLKRKINFESFLQLLPLSAQLYSGIQDFEGYDTVVFGSDQIWNPVLTGGNDNVFSGNIKKCRVKFVAYAASTNPKLLNGNNRDYFTNILENFDTISTRESSLSDYLNSIRPSSSIVVLDPVLLLGTTEWQRIAIKPKESNYLLIYTVPQDDKVYDLAHMIAKQHNLRIIEIRPDVRLRLFSNNLLQSISPQEFIGFFMCASYIVTTSFHGTAFAVKFQKNFATLEVGKSTDDRAQNLLQSIGLKDHMIPTNNLYIPNDLTEYYKTDIALSERIKFSLSFIKDSL